MAEYEGVLLRAKFGFDPDEVAALVDYIHFRGEVVAASPLAMRLPDPDDEPFLEVALSCGADCLVTGNLAHFPEDPRADVLAVSPGEFIAAYRAECVGGDTR